MNKIFKISFLLFIVIIPFFQLKSKDINIYQVDGIKFDKKHISSFEKLSSVNGDSLNQNYIKQVWNKSETFYVKIQLENYDDDVNLSVYNMLGKEVLSIHRGRPKPRDVDYYFNGQLLPNGIYICVLQGKDFRDAEKFVVSR